MSYTYKGKKLYKKDIKLKGGKKTTIYFFSGKRPKSGTPCALPKGKVPKVCKTGLIVLKNK